MSDSNVTLEHVFPESRLSGDDRRVSYYATFVQNEFDSGREIPFDLTPHITRTLPAETLHRFRNTIKVVGGLALGILDTLGGK